MDCLQDKDIEELERALGLPLPDDVRAKYRISNGLLGPTNCQLLYTYKANEHTDIIRMNHLRKEAWFPPAFASIVLVGDDGCGNLIAYDTQKLEAILWNPADGDWVQERRTTVTEIWAHIEQAYAKTVPITS